MKRTIFFFSMLFAILMFITSCEKDPQVQGQTPDYLCFTAISSGSTLTFRLVNDFECNELEYRVNDGLWKNVSFGGSLPKLKEGDKVYVRAKTARSKYIDNEILMKYLNISVSGEGKVKVSGNIMYLLYPDGSTESMPDYAFYRLFYDSPDLVDAGELSLPAMTLSKGCYSNMFYGCANLTTAPALPATALASYCYDVMFYGCTGLTTAPALPAKTLADNCYDGMFYGCTGLATAPALPAMTLAGSCYDQMFEGCTGLTTAPALPATTLEYHCYARMFYGCTGLTTAPALPAKTTEDECYYSMFNGCSSLTGEVNIAAEVMVERCAVFMFSRCSKLSSVKCMAKELMHNAVGGWLIDAGTEAATRTLKVPKGCSRLKWSLPSAVEWTIVEID